MTTGERNILTQIIGSNDKLKTFEIRRTWNGGKKKGLIIELYPTITTDDTLKMDISTLHLLNHAEELGWGSVRILNLYSTVFSGKPSTSKLSEDKENQEYIKTVFSQEDIKEFDIVIAWGSGLANHQPTIKKKIEILEMLKKKKLSKQIKCLEAEYMEDVSQQGVHPLFLGLHHSKEEWQLTDYMMDKAIELLKSSLNKSKKEVKKEPALKVVGKGEANVLQD